ncbi:phosphoribosylglycinamide formyltransferase [Puniceicoccus vermicola]|uniref:Phosphoribosylglycinamide formyltransferase n=1 Tax=Puniceicoccus vermicola TaxID=388746 RepID=A0A7X1E7D8_9BACT|nr:phosphoribosylglycinamide formyltransferase [Puniceicoccus vermicola]MBC2603622.1 phosphoribosylglycinamide formyltransferase [Puniceicoccus vermicola]
MSESKKISVGILGSTRGSALRPIVDAWQQGELGVDLSVVISNRKSAGILEYAREQGIPAIRVSAKDRDREEFDREVSNQLRQHGVQIVLMIGYMRIVSPPFVEEWRGRLLNIHPSLLPRHGGLMDLDVHRSVLEAGDAESGCTLHLAEEEVDAGRIVLQKTCPVVPGETPESLKAKVQELEAESFLELLRNPREFLDIAE